MSRKRDASRVTDHDDLGYMGEPGDGAEEFEGQRVPTFSDPPSNAELARAQWFMERKIDSMRNEIFGKDGYPGMRALILQLKEGGITPMERFIYACGAVALVVVAVLQVVKDS